MVGLKAKHAFQLGWLEGVSDNTETYRKPFCVFIQHIGERGMGSHIARR